MTENQIKRTRILLFHPSSENRLTPIITMGLWGLADHLTTNGFPTTIIHTGLEQELHGGFEPEKYLSQDVLVAGISAHWFPMTAEALKIAALIKQSDSDIFTVLGGFSASYFYQDILQGYPFIDGIIRGDAEQPLLLLAQQLQALGMNRPNLASIPNLTWRDGMRLVENDFSYVATAEKLQPIAFGKFDAYLLNYDRAMQSTAFAKSSALVADFETDFPLAPMFYLLTGKGCSVNCTMCGGGKQAQKLINNRERCMYLSDESIVRTIREGMRLGYRCFYVCFDPSPSNPHYFYWLRKIREEKLDLDLCFGFWGLPTDEAIEELSRTSRNILVDLSPETIDEESRKKNKGFHYTNDELYGTIRKLYNKKIYTHVYFSYFLPHQTPSELAATREAFWKINAMYPHYIEATNLMISTDPASPLQRDPERFDVRLSVHNFQEHLAYCGTTQFTNIHVHEVNSIPKEVQSRYTQILAYDVSIKRLFRYNIKFLVRAFPSIGEFLSYLDRFYEESGLLQASGSKPFEQISDIMRALRNFTHSSYRDNKEIQPYLFDLMDFILAMVESRDAISSMATIIQKSLSSDPAAMIPHLSPVTKIVALEFDIFRANQALRTTKSFPELTPSPVKLLISHRQDKPLVLQLNESLYFLCQSIAENRDSSVRVLIEKLTARFTDEEPQKAAIHRDFLNALQQLVRQGHVLLE